MKVVEFFYFYLMPEAPITPSSSIGGDLGREGNIGGLQRSPSKRVGSGGGQAGTKTTEEKQGLLGRYLNNVEDLVEDLREGVAFGGAVV